jgi:hypothetical protein
MLLLLALSLNVETCRSVKVGEETLNVCALLGLFIGTFTKHQTSPRFSILLQSQQIFLPSDASKYLRFMNQVCEVFGLSFESYIKLALSARNYLATPANAAKPVT